ncbi:lipopolysaccharide kinase InaA family protein [Tautonia plasticadhaerens]|uniref:3-deoxy-D-manno-octulosonic-acid kinase n=1 Tax=Tautonia plasticadhaerens TaxID=2527974 RepID=A0A518H4V2_9BACT|nr:lipopolysaccharide kinase InaA family protein [Tautonia plasticadhaerens]QDV35862.1 3-deoxy-D-manno-octulosonic-acid kinase [Tautonia plasticadhaerens]
MSTIDQSPRTRPEARPTAPGPEGRIFQPPDWEWAHAGEVGWWVLPEWRGVLLTPDGRLRLDEWRDLGLVETVKSGPHRVVWRVALPTGAIYVKQFLVPTWREVLRQWFRRGKGRNEGKRARMLARIGVPTIRPVALGERRVRRFLFENFLISPEIADATPLDRFLRDDLPAMPPRRAAIVRRRVTVALGALTARLHACGMRHDDFHPGNLLLRLDDGDRPRLAMIDLDALRLGKPLGPPQAASNLARLNHASLLLASRADRQRFLDAYVEARGGEIGDLAHFSRRVVGLTRRWAERLWRRRARRCVGSNQDFEAIRRRDRWVVSGRSIDATTLHSLLDDPDAPFSDPSAVLLKHSRTTTVAELTLPVGGRPTRVVYKRFNRKKRLEALLTTVRPSRAWRAWRANHHLRSRGLPTPPDLLVLGRDGRRGPIRLPAGPTETYLMTVKAEPSTTLADFLREALPSLPEGDQLAIRRRLASSLGRLLRDLHERCLSDRDLKASNILIEGDPGATRPSLSLIDLVGVRLISPLPEDRRIQNLARLLASLAEQPGWSRTDSLRLLRAYLPQHEAAAGRWKATWRRISRRIDRKRARNRRRGRPMS